MNKLPRFSGRPLIETPDVPMIGYLEGDFGKAFLEAYNSVVKKRYEGNKILKVLEFNDNAVTGSSTYSSIIAADILRQSGLELARPVDIESARKLHESNSGLGIDTRGFYVDYGIVWRSAEEPNAYLAKTLEPQIKKAIGVEEIENPIVILSGDLELLNDKKAPHGLGFALRKEAKPFAAPVLKRRTSFNNTDESGMPIPDENGTRTSYTNDTCLSGLCLRRYLDLYSFWGGLADSNPGGRVVAKNK